MQSSAIILTGGPAAPGEPSLPRAPCSKQEGRECLSYNHLLTKPWKSWESVCGASPSFTTNVPQSRKIYLQQGQEHQGGLSHQEDHGDPRQKQKEQGQVGENSFDLCPLIRRTSFLSCSLRLIIFSVCYFLQSPKSSWILTCAQKESGSCHS